MGRLAGFKYRQIIKRLKRLGFEFDRQAAGSHEIWYNSNTKGRRKINSTVLIAITLQFGRILSGLR